VIVYVETNFLLELAYRQEKCSSCEEILKLAGDRAVTLALPAFSIAEARVTWQRRALERHAIRDSLQKQIRQISRSEPFRELQDQSQEVMAALVADIDESRERLEKVVWNMESGGIVTIPLTNEIITMARRHEILYSLSPQDALILESVLSHAENKPGLKCFVTQDSRAFANPSVKSELSRHECKVLVNFEDAVGYINNALRPPS